ncbi:MAG: hypothetical protein JWQ27_2466 [Ferruginibacter sp.]|nr:hypothetical protein [Ferruginibacter sp.]
MIQPATLKFLAKLEKNNDRSWFEANRPAWENVKEAFIQFTDELVKTIAQFDPPIGELQAKQCIFRINRDVRFSKDKRPYKNHVSAYFNKGGKKANGAGYYVHIEPGRCFAAAGIWMPPPADLARIRQEIDYNFEEWRSLLENKNFKKQIPAGLESTEKLVRPPKGYTEDDPAIEYLKMKSFIASRSFTDEEVTTPGFLQKVGKMLEATKPLSDFLNRALD